MDICCSEKFRAATGWVMVRRPPYMAPSNSPLSGFMRTLGLLTPFWQKGWGVTSETGWNMPVPSALLAISHPLLFWKIQLPRHEMPCGEAHTAGTLWRPLANSYWDPETWQQQGSELGKGSAPKWALRCRQRVEISYNLVKSSKPKASWPQALR